MHTWTIEDVDLSRLGEVAREMTLRMPRRLVIGLSGTLGAGKTTFAQCLAEAAGVDPEDVTSPTFNLLSSYVAQIEAGPIQLDHLDAYRVSDEDEFLELGIEELFDEPDHWVLIEWAERVRSVMPAETLWIEIHHASDRADALMRTLSFSTSDDRLAETLNLMIRRIQS